MLTVIEPLLRIMRAQTRSPKPYTKSTASLNSNSPTPQPQPSKQEHGLPVPQCAIRIAALVMEHNPAFAVVLQRLNLVPRFAAFLSPDSPQLSVHLCVSHSDSVFVGGERERESVCVSELWRHSRWIIWACALCFCK